LLLLFQLLHLLGLHLLQHRGAAARDLPHPDVKGQLAALGEGRRHGCAAGQTLRHGEAVFTAFLHVAHGLGEARINAVHDEGRRLLAGVVNRAIVSGQDIFQQGCIGAGDGLTGARLDGAEL